MPDLDGLSRCARGDLAARFWDFGNLIAGFSILQFIAFLAVTYSADEKVRDRIFAHPCFVVVLIAAITAFLFIPCLVFCYKQEMALRTAACHPPRCYEAPLRQPLAGSSGLLCSVLERSRVSSSTRRKI